MTLTKKFQKGSILYITETTFVNLNTGEEIDAEKSWIKENYQIIKRDAVVSYGYLTKTIYEVWLIIPKMKQL